MHPRISIEGWVRRLVRRVGWMVNPLDGNFFFNANNRKFLDGSTHLYMRVCLSVGQSVGPSVGPWVRPSPLTTFFSNVPK